MAVSIVGTVSNAKTSGSQPSLSCPHTATGDPLWVYVGRDSAAGVFSNVTYGGVGLTFAGRGHGNRSTELWFLPNPTPGTANIVATPSGNDWITICGRNIVGGQIPGVGTYLGDNFTFTSGNNNSPTLTLVSVTGGLVIDHVVSDNSNQTFTPSGGATRDFQQVDGSSDDKSAGSHAPGAASVTMSWALLSGDTWALAAVSIAPSGLSSGFRASQDGAAVATSSNQAPRLAEFGSVVGSRGNQSQRVSSLGVVVASPSSNTSADVRVTQDAVEIISVPTPAAQVTQFVVETLGSVGVAKGWVSQVVIETLTQPPAVGRISQVVIEVLSHPVAVGRISQVVVETLQYDPQVQPQKAGLGPFMGGGGNPWIE